MRSLIKQIYISVVFLFFFIIIYRCTTTYASNYYYVDKNASGKNNGMSWEDAWESFSDIDWGSIQPGNIIYVSGGKDSTIYYEQLTIRNSGTAAKPITIIAGKYSPSPTGHSGRVIIDGGAQARAQSIYIQNVNYITVKGFECRGGTKGVYIEDYVNVVVLDSLTIYDWYDLAGVFTNGAAPYTVNDVTIRNCSIISFDYIDGQTDGIYSQYSANTVIYNNYIRIKNQQPTAHVDCIQAHRSNGFIIYNNIIISDSVNSPEGGGMPIILGSEGNNPVIIYNNFMYMGGIWYPSGNYSTTCNLRWYDNPPMPPTLVAHNTIVSNGPRVYGMTFEYPGTCINNIVVQFGSGANYTWLVPMNNSTGSAIQVDNIRHNLIWKERTGGNDFGGSWTRNGITRSNFGWSTWVNILGGTGVNANPSFVKKFGYEQNQGFLDGRLKAGSPAINQGENIQALIKTIIDETNIAGGLIWSIRGHRRDGGWYYHNEGGTPINSFHYPGFAAGFVYQESRFIELMKKEAARLNNSKIAEKKPSCAPILFRQNDGFTWRGATGAAFYVIERSENPSGPWTVLATGLHDSVIQDVAKYEHTPEASEPTILYYDETKIKGKKYYYRIKGVNIAGESDYSPVLEITW